MTVGARIQRFEVIAHLGTGGMGSVYRARDPQLERDVACVYARCAGNDAAVHKTRLAPAF